MPFCIVSST